MLRVRGIRHPAHLRRAAHQRDAREEHWFGESEFIG
jgi:hypothetical protein